MSVLERCPPEYYSAFNSSTENTEHCKDCLHLFSYQVAFCFFSSEGTHKHRYHICVYLWVYVWTIRKPYPGKRKRQRDKNNQLHKQALRTIKIAQSDQTESISIPGNYFYRAHTLHFQWPVYRAEREMCSSHTVWHKWRIVSASKQSITLFIGLNTPAICCTQQHCTLMTQSKAESLHKYH